VESPWGSPSRLPRSLGGPPRQDLPALHFRGRQKTRCSSAAPPAPTRPPRCTPTTSSVGRERQRHAHFVHRHGDQPERRELPVSATSGGSTFRFEGGVPSRRRAPRVRCSASVPRRSGADACHRGQRQPPALRESAGCQLNGIQMNVHASERHGPQCDSIVGSSCTPYGVPTHENDVIALRLALDIDMTVTSFFMSFGLMDRVDIGVVLPIVLYLATRHEQRADHSFRRHDRAAFLRRYARQPQLSTSRFVDGSATGIGDLAATGQGQRHSDGTHHVRGSRRCPVPHRERGRPPRLRARRGPRPRHPVGAIRGFSPHAIWGTSTGAGLAG